MRPQPREAHMDRYETHYHIRWSRVVALDWECFSTFDEAETRAKELVRRDETYTIEERDEACPRCQAAMNLKTAHEGPKPVYAWQQAVADAFRAYPEDLPLKVNAAERAISARLMESIPADNQEHIAIQEALASLHALLPTRANEINNLEKAKTA